MSQTLTQTIRLSPADNVVVARAALRSDTRVEEEDLTTTGAIDPGHKIATQLIKKGDTIRKYDQIIGIAESDIRPGQHVHTHNLRMDDFDRDYKFSESVRELDFVKPEDAATFQGIVRSDGRVGTRNYIGVLTSVNCSPLLHDMLLGDLRKRSWQNSPMSMVLLLSPMTMAAVAAQVLA